MSAATHPIAPEEVMALLDGELSPERAEAISKHINECAECLKVRDSFRGTSQLLTGWTVPTLPQGIGERLLNNSASNLSPHQFLSGVRTFLGRRSVLAWGGAVVAALLLFMSLNFEFSPRMAQRSTPNAAMVQPELDISPYQAKLPAGSARPVAPRAGADGGGGRVSKTDADKSLQNFEEEGVGRERERPVNGRSYGTLGQVIPSEPMIARTVSLTVVVKDFDAGRASLDGVLAKHNGYAANLSVSTPQGTARVIEASLRIPAPQLAAAISELKTLGRVENETQNGEEVTQQHADLVARLKNSRETEQRLQDVLRTRTGKVKDVLEVEEEIARVRGEIEQMEAEQKTLEHRVEFATIELKLAEEYKAQLNPPAPSVWMQLRNATINGFRNAFETVLSIVLFFAESGPTLVVWLTILGMPAWVLWRRYRRVHALGAVGGT